MAFLQVPGGSIRIQTDFRDISSFAQRMERWARDALPFVEAASLTDTAKDAQAFLRQGLVEHFKLRNPQVKNGIAYEPASKRDSIPQAKVGTREWAEFLTFHAISGLKRSKKGHRIAVPTRLVKRGATGRVPARFKPRQLREAKGFDPGELARRAKIVVRKGNAARRRGASTYFNLVTQARIKKRWPFEEEVTETVRARLPQHFATRMRQALAP